MVSWRTEPEEIASRPDSGSEPFCSLTEANERLYRCLWRPIDPPNQTVYLLRQELAQTRWFAGHCRMFIRRNPQPRRPPVEGTSSGPASMARLREEEE